jgi:hypothetical protein
VFNGMGQQITQVTVKDGANNSYIFDLSHYQSGTYIVRAVFTDRVVTRKIIKL